MEEKLGVQFNDEEVALVAMYFQVSLEKVKMVKDFNRLSKRYRHFRIDF